MDKRTRLDREYYEREARFAAGLTDLQRVEIMRDLYVTSLIFQSSKDAATLEAEAKAERLLNEPHFSRRYLQLMQEAEVKGAPVAHKEPC